MLRTGPLATALRISRVSSPALTNVGTAVTSLVLVPLLEVLLIIAVSASLGGTELVITAYAAILVAYGLSTITGTIGQVTRDRQIGVLQDALTHHFFYVPYWLSKVIIPVVLGAAVSVTSCAAVFFIDPASSTQALAAALALLPAVALGASLVAIGVATLSLGSRDPFLVANLSTAILPLTAGVIIPVTSYPAVVASAGYLLPLTGAVQAMRAIEADASLATIWMFLGRELLVCLFWLLAGYLASKGVVRALRDGRRNEDIW